MLEEVLRDSKGNIVQRRTVSSKVRIRCEMCQEIIATIDRNTIEAPIFGSMFESPDTAHGIPAPFHESLEWEAMRCPICRTRPFIADDPETAVIILLENHEHITARPKEKLPVDEIREDWDMKAIDETMVETVPEAYIEPKDMVVGIPIMVSDEVPPDTILIVDSKNIERVPELKPIKKVDGRSLRYKNKTNTKKKVVRKRKRANNP
jgi:hypothetical protein